MSKVAEELAARLQSEAMSSYTNRFPSERFGECTKTFNFFIHLFAARPGMDKVKLPIQFMQELCTLGRDGFEAATGYQYEHEKEDLRGQLENIWSSFTITLMLWVMERKQRVEVQRCGSLWYSCFEVPSWFVLATLQTYQENREMYDDLLKYG